MLSPTKQHYFYKSTATCSLEVLHKKYTSKRFAAGELLSSLQNQALDGGRHTNFLSTFSALAFLVTRLCTFAAASWVPASLASSSPATTCSHQEPKA